MRNKTSFVGGVRATAGTFLRGTRGWGRSSLPALLSAEGRGSFLASGRRGGPAEKLQGSLFFLFPACFRTAHHFYSAHGNLGLQRSGILLSPSNRSRAACWRWSSVRPTTGVVAGTPGILLPCLSIHDFQMDLFPSTQLSLMPRPASFPSAS